MRRYGLLLLVLADVVVWSFALHTAAAGAYATPEGLEPSKYSKVCPPRPADAPEGATPNEVATVTISQELADACYRAEQRAEAAHTDSESLKTVVASVLAKLEGGLKTTLEGEPTVKVGNLAEQPTGGTVELSAGAKESLEQKSGLGPIVILLGFLVGSQMCWILYTFWRRRNG